MNIREEINAWKQANQELEMENLKLKYWLFGSALLNLTIILVFIYENLH
jgi:hypothetical protein